jgi:hypothetical protein
MTTAKRPLRMLLRLAALFAAVACVDTLAPDRFLLRGMSNIVLTLCALALTMFFSDHVIDRDTRAFLTAGAGLAVLWAVLRGAKYIAFEESQIIARHIWYLYYVPILGAPLFALLAARSVGERERRLTRGELFTAAVTAALILLVLTNDAHQLVFRFHPGFADWDADYARGPAFFAVYLWVIVLLAAVYGTLFARCRVSSSRRLIWAPLLPALFGVLYLVLYAADLWPRLNGGLLGEFPEAVCFSMAGVWLSLVSIGLIPSNEGYGKLFEASDLAAQIADRDGRVIYRSSNAAALTAGQLAAGGTISLDRDTRLHRKSVRGGFVYWQDDVAELNRINGELWELSERLAEEAELVRLENELKEERAQIEAKTRVYDDIAARVLPQSQRITALCEAAEREPALFSENMKTVCLLAAYIKRCANLSLLAADRAELGSDELQLAVSESLRCVADMGIPVDEDYAGGALLPARCLLAAYALFETLLEQALPTLRGIQVSLRGNELKLAAEGAALALPEGSGASLATEDGVSYVRLALERAGEAI